MARYNSSGLSGYWHPDWQGSMRLSSTPTRTVGVSNAYAPYGEPYAASGFEPYFAGLIRDIAVDIYDPTFRKYHMTQGRFISPDPAGLAAMDFSNPQTLNRYAYVANNPLLFTDPTGLGGNGSPPDCADPTYWESNAQCGNPPPSCDWAGDCGGPIIIVGGGGGGNGTGTAVTSDGSGGGGNDTLIWSSSTGPDFGVPQPTFNPQIDPFNIVDLLGLSGGFGCDFGACGGPSPNALVSDTRVVNNQFAIYVYVMELLNLPPDLMALRQAGRIASPVASPWAPAAWYGLSAAVALSPAAPRVYTAAKTLAANNPITWICGTSFAYNFFTPLISFGVETDDYPCGTAGQMASAVIWTITHPQGK